MHRVPRQHSLYDPSELGNENRLAPVFNGGWGSFVNMNQVLKNTHIFVDVLGMARCDSVQEWDEAAFRKAYKWAHYFEEVSQGLSK